MIIGFTGKARAGKNTAAQYFIDRGYIQTSFAEPVYESAWKLNPWIELPSKYLRLQTLIREVGWEYAKRYSDVRQTLQRVGTELGREVFGQDCWLDIWKRSIPGENVVVTDVRFDNEAKAIIELGGEIWCITSDRTSTDDLHESERGIAPNLISVYIDNSGTIEELYEAIKHEQDNKRSK